MKTNAEINEDNQQKQQTVSGHAEPLVTWPHFDAIMSIFEDLYEEWMSEEDRIEFVRELMEEAGVSFSTLHSDIEIGLNNGYTIKQQVKIAKRALTPSFD